MRGCLPTYSSRNYMAVRYQHATAPFIHKQAPSSSPPVRRYHNQPSKGESHETQSKQSRRLV